MQVPQPGLLHQTPREIDRVDCLSEEIYYVMKPSDLKRRQL
jgi:hypothetical protein